MPMILEENISLQKKKNQSDHGVKTISTFGYYSSMETLNLLTRWIRKSLVKAIIKRSYHEKNFIWDGLHSQTGVSDYITTAGVFFVSVPYGLLKVTSEK